MRDQVEGLLDGYDEGRLSREELVDQLAALAGEPLQRSSTDALFRSRGLNHVALSVSDVGAMADFLCRHLGTSVIEVGEQRGFVASGANTFVGLFRRPPTGLDHVCFTVEGYDPDDAAARLEDAGLRPLRTEDRVFFRGPDRVLFQVADFWGDYPTPGRP